MAKSLHFGHSTRLVWNNIRLKERDKNVFTTAYKWGIFRKCVCLTAVGYSLVFSVVGLINMSHAAIYMSGAVCFSMFYNLGGRNVPLLVVF